MDTITLTLTRDEADATLYALGFADDGNPDGDTAYVKIMEALSEPDPEQRCAMCRKPRREHRPGYSARHQFVEALSK